MLANFLNADYTTEYMVYAHGAPATKNVVMDQVEALSMRLNGDKGIRVAFDNDVSWPFTWYLREYPLDLITWTVQNSHRKDVDQLEANFREQHTKEVLPPDELRIARHNANRFVLDGGNGGRSEYSAGDIWILPYWMGRAKFSD